jgi:hypothetical protein
MLKAQPRVAVLLKLELEVELNEIGGRRPMTNGSCDPRNDSARH